MLFAKNFEDAKCQYRALPQYMDTGINIFFVLDLNRNGLEIDTSKTAVIRDYYRDSYILDGWFKENDGILVIDRTKINDLIGFMDSSEKNSFVFGRSPRSLFKAFDEDKDGVIDPSDAGYKFLFVWQDTNQDMIIQPDEVNSLASYGINIDLVNKSSQCENSEETCSSALSSDDNLLCHDNDGAMEMHGVTLLHYV